MNTNLRIFILLLLCLFAPLRDIKGAAQKPLPGTFPKNIPESIILKIEKTDHVLPRAEINSWIAEKNFLLYNSAYNSEIENPDACNQKNHAACSLTLPIAKEGHMQKVSYFSPDKNRIEKFLEDLARQKNRDPQDGKLQMENGKVSLFSISSNGIKLDTKKSLGIIIKNLDSGKEISQEINLPYEEIKPAVSLDSIENMGITSLIGEGISNFSGSPKNRIFNIKVASNRFNGVLITPGEDFSFVRVLGEVDGEHGYLPELVIKKDKTEPEFGGGICQVSTTAFRAAINSGLKITARRNHAYPVRYYNPQGMDATVYVPRPDLRFINNTPGHILIQTKIEGTQLVFQFYGTSDGRKIAVEGPVITERNPDGSMKASFAQKVYDVNNNILIDDTFNSAYDSPAKYPHPGEVLTVKPEDWSNKEWKKYKTEHKI